MRKLRYHLVDVFTNERFGGNPLAVFTNGRGVEPALMQTIARELNLSETVFVLPPEDPANHWRLRIFTPATELPMAGHPTVGTAYVLAREHLVDVTGDETTIRLEEPVGVIPVTFSFDDRGALSISMTQPNPTFGPMMDDRAGIAALLSLSPDDLLPLPIQVVSTGVPFIFVPVRDLDAMRRIKVRLDLWEQSLKDTPHPHLLTFTPEVEVAGSHVHVRMFAPAMGIPEDPATGGAAGPLGCYLVQHGLVKDSPAAIIAEQGFEMGRRSFLHIGIEQQDGEITRVTVGGQSVPVGEGVIEV
ncbi:MAG TPA: PhzF family phenazine biosynthesis protein [Aggregatilineales bacterium]|nr:PhzF family phenazine biosynthesis protein [Aggregatilineales bacterium]